MENHRRIVEITFFTDKPSECDRQVTTKIMTKTIQNFFFFYFVILGPVCKGPVVYANEWWHVSIPILRCLEWLYEYHNFYRTSIYFIVFLAVKYFHIFPLSVWLNRSTIDAFVSLCLVKNKMFLSFKSWILVYVNSNSDFLGF